MSVVMSIVDVFVNGTEAGAGQLRVEQEIHTEWTNLPQPDPNWSHTDAAGHFHAYDIDSRDHYPTLIARNEHQPCDGVECGDDPCDGYTITRRHCVICEEEIKPGTTTGPHSWDRSGLKHWQVQARIAAPITSDRVSVRLVSGNPGHGWFGIATIVDTTFRSGDDRVTVTLVGVGPLGRRIAS